MLIYKGVIQFIEEECVLKLGERKECLIVEIRKQGGKSRKSEHLEG